MQSTRESEFEQPRNNHSWGQLLPCIADFHQFNLIRPHFISSHVPLGHAAASHSSGPLFSSACPVSHIQPNTFSSKLHAEGHLPLSFIHPHTPHKAHQPLGYKQATGLKMMHRSLEKFVYPLWFVVKEKTRRLGCTRTRANEVCEIKYSS